MTCVRCRLRVYNSSPAQSAAPIILIAMIVLSLDPYLYLLDVAAHIAEVVEVSC